MTFGGAFGGVFRPAFDQGLAAAATPWWLSGGIAAANAVAVYQPKGAASLAASYVNLANPGTYNAAPGVAPTWASATGWGFDGATQYLTTGVIPSGTWSMLLRLSGATAATKYIAGASTTNQAFFLLHTAASMLFYNNTAASGGITSAGAPGTDVFAIAGINAYRNGAVVSGTMPGTAQAVSQITIGVVATTNYFPGNIQAFAIYNTTLSAAQVLAVSTSMAAL